MYEPTVFVLAVDHRDRWNLDQLTVERIGIQLLSAWRHELDGEPVSGSAALRWDGMYSAPHVYADTDDHRRANEHANCRHVMPSVRATQRELEIVAWPAVA